MFVTLLAITLALPLVLSLFVASVIRDPAAAMFARMLGDSDGTAWARVLQVILVLGGTAGGVPIYDLERITGLSGIATPLTQTRWTMTIYECVLGSVDALASALMSVLCVAMITYALRRRRESRERADAVGDAPTSMQTVEPTGALAADGLPRRAGGA